MHPSWCGTTIRTLHSCDIFGRLVSTRCMLPRASSSPTPLLDIGFVCKPHWRPLLSKTICKGFEHEACFLPSSLWCKFYAPPLRVIEAYTWWMFAFQFHDPSKPLPCLRMFPSCFLTLTTLFCAPIVILQAP